MDINYALKSQLETSQPDERVCLVFDWSMTVLNAKKQWMSNEEIDDALNRAKSPVLEILRSMEIFDINDLIYTGHTIVTAYPDQFLELFETEEFKSAQGRILPNIAVFMVSPVS